MRKLKIASTKMQEKQFYVQYFSDYNLYFLMLKRLKNGNPYGLSIDPMRKTVTNVSVRNERLWQPIEAEEVYGKINKKMTDKIQLLMGD